MSGGKGLRRVLIGVIFLTIGLVATMSGCALFEDEKAAKGRKLYHHYCMHCHGENGYQGEGFNWDRMPDPRPRDLSEDAAMSTFSDEEIFHTISRVMRDTSDPKVIEDENYFAVSTMPTFKYTLSEQELWAIVGHVRSLHGGSLTYDVEGRKKQLESDFQSAQQEHDAAKQAFDVAQAKLDEELAAKEAAWEAEMEAKLAADPNYEEEDFEEEEVVLPEEEVFDAASEKLAKAKMALDNFTKRPKRGQIARPDLTMSDEERVKLEQKGKHLYSAKYGCHGCHSLGEQGGLVGPALDRAGFRLNSTWIYRWIMYPQSMKKHTRMPNLGFDDEDARAVTAYLNTLRAPKPDKPIPLPE